MVIMKLFVSRYIFCYETDRDRSCHPQCIAFNETDQQKDQQNQVLVPFSMKCDVFKITLFRMRLAKDEI